EQRFAERWFQIAASLACALGVGVVLMDTSGEALPDSPETDRASLQGVNTQSPEGSADNTPDTTDKVSDGELRVTEGDAGLPPEDQDSVKNYKILQTEESTLIYSKDARLYLGDGNIEETPL